LTSKTPGRIMFPMTVFAQLGEENWGERVRRARNRRGVGLKEAARHLSEAFQPVGINTLQRMEMLPAPPSDRKRLLLAAVYIASLGYDPADFDIDVMALPAMFRSTDELVARVLMPSSA
jgi:hypothetical protein